MNDPKNPMQESAVDATATPATDSARRVPPALLIFLIFPLIGMLIAAALIFSEAAARVPAAATPPPVTVVVPPTPVNLADAPMIDFTLTALTGEDVALADYAGRPVFLNFWATWCEPCRRELPALAAFQRAQGDEGAAVLAVNIEEAPDEIRAFLNDEGVTDLTVLLDPFGDTADDYGVFQLPVTFVIDAQGVVRQPHFGEITEADLQGYVAFMQST